MPIFRERRRQIARPTLCFECHGDAAHELAGRIGEARAVTARMSLSIDAMKPTTDRMLLEPRGRSAHSAGGEGSSPDASELMSSERDDDLAEHLRLSSRARPRSNSLSGTSVSITGSMPDAILAGSRGCCASSTNEPMIDTAAGRVASG